MVYNIPSDQITNIVDGVASGGLSAAYEQAHKAAEEHKIIDPYRVLDGGVLLALDGTWTFSSENIHCKHCLSVANKNKTLYYQVYWHLR